VLASYVKIFLQAGAASILPGVELNWDGATLFKVNAHGYKKGWAFVPFNFDPIWITCSLPLGKKEDEKS